MRIVIFVCAITACGTSPQTKTKPEGAAATTTPAPAPKFQLVKGASFRTPVEFTVVFDPPRDGLRLARVGALFDGQPLGVIQSPPAGDHVVNYHLAISSRGTVSKWEGTFQVTIPNRGRAWMALVVSAAHAELDDLTVVPVTGIEAMREALGEDAEIQVNRRSIKVPEESILHDALIAPTPYPSLPESERRAGVLLMEVVRICVDNTGRVRSIGTLRTSNAIFRTAVFDSVFQWRYDPERLRNASNPDCTPNVFVHKSVRSSPPP